MLCSQREWWGEEQHYLQFYLPGKLLSNMYPTCDSSINYALSIIIRFENTHREKGKNRMWKLRTGNLPKLKRYGRYHRPTRQGRTSHQNEAPGRKWFRREDRISKPQVEKHKNKKRIKGVNLVATIETSLCSKPHSYTIRRSVISTCRAPTTFCLHGCWPGSGSHHFQSGVSNMPHCSFYFLSYYPTTYSPYDSQRHFSKTLRGHV